MAHIYAGISGMPLSVESFDLGEGVLLKRTYARLFSPFLVAFAPPGPEGRHPPPWSAAEGGFGFDVHVQLSLPDSSSLGGESSATDLVWWIAALLRVARFPYVSVPVLSSHPFADIPAAKEKVRLRPMEVTPRIMRPTEETPTTSDSALEWVKDRWVPAGRLLYSHRAFRSAFQAFDSATLDSKRSSSLLALWGALEQLFGSGRYRIASFIAAYLSPPGDERLATYRRVLQLYDARSAAAHTADNAE